MISLVIQKQFSSLAKEVACMIIVLPTPSGPTNNTETEFVAFKRVFNSSLTFKWPTISSKEIGGESFTKTFVWTKFLISFESLILFSHLPFKDLERQFWSDFYLEKKLILSSIIEFYFSLTKMSCLI